MDDLSRILKENQMTTSSLYDFVAEKAQNRSLVITITVFSYGFIILISLIAAANVFNTISTNILLRRRLLYGLKGMLLGLPVSLFVNWRIYCAVGKGWETGFYLPWPSYLIAIFSVFAVVGSTMIYSMRKVKQENIVDELKIDG